MFVDDGQLGCKTPRLVGDCNVDDGQLGCKTPDLVGELLMMVNLAWLQSTSLGGAGYI